MGHEGRAVEIGLSEIGILPGLMQTHANARAVAEGDLQRGSITPEQVDERVSFLLDRQATLVRVRPPMVFVVMDESCLLQAVGGPKGVAAQLQRLEELAALPNWFSMSPRSESAHAERSTCRSTCSRSPTGP